MVSLRVEREGRVTGWAVRGVREGLTGTAAVSQKGDDDGFAVASWDVQSL